VVLPFLTVAGFVLGPSVSRPGVALWKRPGPGGRAEDELGRVALPCSIYRHPSTAPAGDLCALRAIFRGELQATSACSYARLLHGLEAAPIGEQFFAHGISRRDWTAFWLVLDTYATRLLA
jgi:hypothetical protein